MPQFNADNESLAHEIISRYPVARSALIPLCHLAQEQDGYLTDDAMQHIGELLGIEAAEVLGTASFYEMFKRHPVGTYVINVCTSISCFLDGGDELLEHAEERLGIKEGGTTEDGTFSLEGYECIAACTEAPCLQVNYRYFHRITHDELDALIDDLGAGRRDDIPRHGTLQRTRQHIDPDRAAGVVTPDGGGQPVWLRDHAALEEAPS
ncbi:MAG TPA: NAD(P)H-dependent oxidoreductase subunit E [Acidimicrobiales bacterium]|jgi:NADH-quinone oxidoreductase subunit E